MIHFSTMIKHFLGLLVNMEPTAQEPHFNITIKDNDVITGAKEIVLLLRPSWPSDQLSHKV